MYFEIRDAINVCNYVCDYAIIGLAYGIKLESSINIVSFYSTGYSAGPRCVSVEATLAKHYTTTSTPRHRMMAHVDRIIRMNVMASRDVPNSHI